MKHLKDISIYDLAAEDWYVYADKNITFGYDLNLLNDDEDSSVSFIRLHPVAAQSLAKTCKKIYEAIERLKIQD